MEVTPEWVLADTSNHGQDDSASCTQRKTRDATRKIPVGPTMTIAGESAGVEARHQRRDAQELRRQADDAEQRAARFEIAERTESETAQLLAPLAGIGYRLLADRPRPGSRTAQVDMVVVGRAGVLIVDTKAWRELAVHGDRITRGQEDVTDDIARLADLANSTEAALADTGRAPGEIHAVVALAGQKHVHARVASSTRSRPARDRATWSRSVENRVAVCDVRGNAVLTYDVSGQPRELGRAAVPGRAFWIRADPDTGTVYTALSNTNRIVKLTVRSDGSPELDSTVPTVRNPVSFDRDPSNGALYVGGYADSDLQIIPADAFD